MKYRKYTKVNDGLQGIAYGMYIHICIYVYMMVTVDQRFCWYFRILPTYSLLHRPKCLFSLDYSQIEAKNRKLLGLGCHISLQLKKNNTTKKFISILITFIIDWQHLTSFNDYLRSQGIPKNESGQDQIELLLRASMTCTLVQDSANNS